MSGRISHQPPNRSRENYETLNDAFLFYVEVDACVGAAFLVAFWIGVGFWFVFFVAFSSELPTCFS
jgi:hypothetical protein